MIDSCLCKKYFVRYILMFLENFVRVIELFLELLSNHENIFSIYMNLKYLGFWCQNCWYFSVSSEGWNCFSYILIQVYMLLKYVLKLTLFLLLLLHVICMTIFLGHRFILRGPFYYPGVSIVGQRGHA